MCVCFASPVLLQMCNDSEDILFYFAILLEDIVTARIT